MKIINFACITIFLFTVFTTAALAQKMKAEDVLAKHLDSIGTADARAAAKTLITVGNGTAQFMSTKDQVMQGRIVFASEGNKDFLGMNMNSNFYTGEKFAFDGKSIFVGYIYQNNRSVLGNFVQSNGSMISDGLIGGTLSTSWAMTNLSNSKAKLSFGGVKKIDGKELYAIGFSRKGGGDLDITLFFDKQTFQHVRTEYTRVSSAAIGLRPEQSSGFKESRYKLVEEFSDFKPEGSLTLPHSYRMFYSLSGQQGTTEIEWKFTLTEFAVNQKLDATTFTPKN